MRTRKTLPLIAASVLLAACGGGDDEAVQTTAGDQHGVALPSDSIAPVGGMDTSTTAGAVPAPGAVPGPAPATAPQPKTTTPPASSAPATSGGSGNAQLVQQGQQIYASGACVACHGANAEGGPLAPSLRDGQWIWIEPGANMHTQMATLIRTGVAQPKNPAQHPAPMPPMGGMQLNDEQLNALVAYLISINPR